MRKYEQILEVVGHLESKKAVSFSDIGGGSIRGDAQHVIVVLVVVVAAVGGGG